MSAAFEDSETPQSVPLWKAALGWILIAAACLLAIGVAVKAGDAFAGGREIGRLFGSWLFIVLLAWGVTLKRSPGAKANARIVVGVLLLLTTLAVIGNGNDAKQKEVGKKFLQDAIALNKQHEQRFVLLGERFTKTDMSKVLAPESVTTRAGIASSRATVAQYRGLIAERGAVLKLNLQEGIDLVLKLPAGDVRKGAQTVIDRKAKETASTFKDLDRAELAQLALVEKILDWCAAQGNKLKHQQGQFLFTTEAQQSQFQALLDELRKIELEVGYASKAVERKAARVAEKNVENLNKAKKMLGD
jgi:hypothetical protein